MMPELGKKAQAQKPQRKGSMMKRCNKLAVTASAFTGLTLAVLIGAQAAPIAAAAGTCRAPCLTYVLKRVQMRKSQRGCRWATPSLSWSKDDWYKIVTGGGGTGYVASYISGVEAAENFTTTGTVNDNVRMRSAPSTSAKILENTGRSRR